MEYSFLNRNGRTLGTAVLGRPVQVSLLVEDEPIRPPTIGAEVAVVVRTEAVKHRFGLGPRCTQQYTKNEKPK
jgi:hypothetical protein